MFAAGPHCIVCLVPRSMRRPLLAPRAVWTLCHKTSLSRADHMTRPCSWWHHVFAVPWSLPMPSHLNAQEEGRWCWQRWLWQLLLPSLPRGQEDAEQLVRCGVIAAIWIQAGALLHVSSAAMAQPQGNTSPVCTGGFMYRQVLVGDRHCLWQASSSKASNLCKCQYFLPACPMASK